MLAIQNQGFRMRVWSNEKKNVKMPPALRSYLKKDYFPIFKKVKKIGLIKTSKNASIKLIRRLLEREIPILAEVHSNTWFKVNKWPPQETHVVVSVGYNKGKFIINDPCMP